MDRHVLELRDVTRMLWRHKVLVVVILLACLGGAVAHTAMAPKRYSASSRVLLLPVVPGSVLKQSGSAASGALGLDMDPKSQAQVIDSTLVAARVVRAQKLIARPADLVANITVRAGETQIVQIDATAPTQLLAARLADSFAVEYLAYRRDLTSKTIRVLTDDAAGRAASISRQLGTVQSLVDDRRRVTGVTEGDERLQALTAQRDTLSGQLNDLSQKTMDLQSARRLPGGGGQIVQRAGVTGVLISPQPVRDLGIGLLAGLLLCVVVVFLLEYFDDRVRSPADVESRSGAPVLGIVPRLGGAFGTRPAEVVAATAPSSGPARLFRRLRGQLMAAGAGDDRRVLLIASADDSGGSAMVAVNLATAFAKAGLRTLVVSLDVEHHRAGTLLGMPKAPGLTDLLMDHLPLPSVLVDTAVANLAMVPGGSGGPDVIDLFASAQMSRVIADLRQLADVVLVEVSAASAAGNVPVLAAQADGVVVTARAGVGRHRDLQATVRDVQAAGTGLLGVVLTQGTGRLSSSRTTERPHLSRQSENRPRVPRFRADRVESREQM